MAERTNRRDLIIQTAAGLFIKQGYAATSVRQIAKAAGCTEAAMYYHFKDGKRALLQTVVEGNSPDFVSVLEGCRQATSLSQLIITYIHCMCTYCDERERHVQWLVSEFPNLSVDEKKLFHEKHLAFHAALIKLLRPFIKDESEAEELGWMLICASFGYRQVFITLELNKLVDFPVENFAKKITHYVAENP